MNKLSPVVAVGAIEEYLVVVSITSFSDGHRISLHGSCSIVVAKIGEYVWFEVVRFLRPNNTVCL